MRQLLQIAAVAAAVLVSVPAAAQTVTYNTSPSNGFHYGSGNDYTPANAAVLNGTNGELALRIHQTGVVASASDTAGVYSFALDTTPISFDFYIEPTNPASFLNARINIRNVATGLGGSFNPFILPDNYNDVTTHPLDTSFQNSERFNFGFVLGSNFTPNVDSTYSVNFTNGTDSLTTFARLGAGAPAGAVPEPATWAMMLVGFGAVGFGTRRRTRKVALQAA